jgi:uncharacterized protein
MNAIHRALFRFYEELNDFLPSRFKKETFYHPFKGNPSVKDLIESIGVPHTEVDMILVNGESVDFSYRVKDGDHISVYPEFEALDISGSQHLREMPLRTTRFVLDVHLGKLTRYLRMLGFDCLYDNSFSDDQIIATSLKETRIILTRDKMMLKNRKITHGYWIRSVDPEQQVREIVNKFDLVRSFNPLSRCVECNSEIVGIGKDEILDRLPEKTRLYYNSFMICSGCKRIYWEGSHFVRMKKFIESFFPS